MKKITTRLRRSSPIILTCLSIAGTVGTVITAVRATPKALMLIEEKKKEIDTNELTPEKIILTVWKCYIPSALMGVGTIACIIGIGVMDKRNQAALASAYAMLSESYKNYRNAAKSAYGEDADNKIHAEMAKDANITSQAFLSDFQSYNMDMDSESERILCYDLFSQRYFNTTMAAVINAQYHINRNLQLRGYCSLNEYYSFLGIEEVKYGDEMGWSLDNIMEDGIIWLEFDNRKTLLDDGLECCVISIFEPTKFDGELDI